MLKGKGNRERVVVGCGRAVFFFHVRSTVADHDGDGDGDREW